MNQLVSRCLSSLAVGAIVAMASGTAAAGSLTPPKLLGISHVNQNWGSYVRTISFYDVSDLNSAFDKTGVNGYVDSLNSANDPGTFARPLFSVFLGYEDSPTQNWEEFSAVTSNPANGRVYVAAFDSGATGTVAVDDMGNPTNLDTNGVMDLYEIDALALYRTHVAQQNDPGTMYLPSHNADFGTNPLFAFEAGRVDVSTFFSPPASYVGGWDAVNGVQTGPIRKIGELARNDSGGAPSAFFDFDLEFVNPATLIMLDQYRQSEVVQLLDENGFPVFDPETFEIVLVANPDFDPVADDARLVAFNRISSLPGAAPGSQNALNEGGYNGQTAQSWETNELSTILMDFDGSGNPVGKSEPRSIAFVEKDGVAGVWVLEGDMPANADDLAFFEIDFSAFTAAKKEIQLGSGDPFPTGFSMQNPNHPDNNGQGTKVFVDGDGNLVLVQEGFFFDPSVAPGITTREVLNYDAADTDASGSNEVVVGDWAFSGPVTGQTVPSVDARFAVYDKGEKHMYFLDFSSKNVYVVDADPDSATFGTVLFEFDQVINHFIDRTVNTLVTFGDMTGDGRVTTLDIDALVDAWKGTDDLLKEQFDLTGDGTATKDDVDVLIEVILGTAYGDVNLDGKVDDADLAIIQANLGQSGGYGDGSVSLSGKVDLYSAYLLFQNYGFDVSATSTSVSAIPEPASLSLLALGGMALLRRRR